MGQRVGLSWRAGLRHHANSGRLSLDWRREGARSFRRSDVSAVRSGIRGAAPGPRCSASPPLPMEACGRGSGGRLSFAITPGVFREHSARRRPAGVSRLRDARGDATMRCCWPRSRAAQWPTAADASHRLRPPSAMPSSSFVISIAEASDGDIWLGTRDAGLLRVHGERRHADSRRAPARPQDQLPAAGNDWRGVDRHRPWRRAVERDGDHECGRSAGAATDDRADHDSRSRIEHLDRRGLPRTPAR